MVKIIGKMIIISMSKIKKITAIMKKWIENGIRLYDIGLKPHSNGVDFCLSIVDFFLTKVIRIVIIIIIIIIVVIDIIIKLIIHLIFIIL